MEQFVIRVDGVGNPIELPISYKDLKYLLPNISFPDICSREAIVEFGYEIWKPSDITLEMTAEMLEQPYFYKIVENLPLYDEEQQCFIQQWTWQEFTQTEKDTRILQEFREIRQIRDKLLQESDSITLSDSPLPESKRKEWIIYRQKLRDIPQQNSNPFQITWPKPPSTVVDDTIAGKKKLAITKINILAGQARKQFMTDIPGQESTYLLKEQEAVKAKAVLDANEIFIEADYPILNAERISCNMTWEQILNLVLGTSALFRQVAADIEGKRRGAIIKIESATTVEEIEAAMQINWPINLNP